MNLTKSIKFNNNLNEKMHKNYQRILLIFVCILLASCVKNSPKIFIETGEKTIAVDIEVADDNSERMKGLMFRENLDENSGMLLIFENLKAAIYLITLYKKINMGRVGARGIRNIEKGLANF